MCCVKIYSTKNQYNVDQGVEICLLVDSIIGKLQYLLRFCKN